MTKCDISKAPKDIQPITSHAPFTSDSHAIFFEVEAYLDGSFTKHSSNSGFVADDVVRTPRKKRRCADFSEDQNKKIFQHGDVSFPSDMFQRLSSSSVSYLGICTVDVGGHLQESLTKGYLVLVGFNRPPKKFRGHKETISRV